MPNISTPKQKLIKQILTLLGNNIIDLDDHLTTDDIMTCIDLALDRYRQRAGNSQEESIAFLTLQPDQQDYILPQETMEVREIFRKSLSPTTSGQSSATEFDPFNIAYTNIYLLQAGGQQGLATWELYNEYLETASLLFGGHYNFTWDHRTKRLRIVRNQKVEEEVLLWIYNRIPDESIITDTYAGPWVRSFALAQAKMILGQAYEKFNQLAGPQGGVTLNGASLKAEGKEEMDKLEEELRVYIDGSNPLGFIVG